MLKLRTKFMIGMALLLFLPVVMMGAISYFAFSGMIENKTSSYYALSLQDTDSKLKYALNEVNTVTDLAITQNSIQQLLKSPPPFITSELQQEINSYVMIHPKITSFSLYTNQGLLYRSGASPTDMTFEQLKSAPWHERMQELNGRPLWIGPGENAFHGLEGPAVLHARVIKDYHSLENIGVLVVYVKPDILEQVFWEASTLNEGNIILVNQSGSIVYSKSGEHVGENVDFTFLNPESGQTAKEFFIEDYYGVRSFMTHLPSFNPYWNLVAITDLDKLQADSGAIRNVVLAMVMFLLLTAFVFENFFVSRLVQTIIKTVKGLKDVERGTFREIRMQHESKDETGMLVTGFNRMSRQIRELITQVETEQKRKKEAEMQALVAQINPHFIYNSLESINSLAVIHGNQDISRMVISLGKLLRISISESQELIPLSMEIEHVKHYMNIQKYRFGDKFDFDIELPNRLKSVLTQKLIIQPIVENALYHGIESMEGNGFIKVRVTDHLDDILIDIEDNGPGFGPGALSGLWSDSDRQPKKYKDNGVGLKNVHERLRLHLGSPYGIVICSWPGHGTIIRIRVPKMYNKTDAYSDGRGGTP